MGMTEELHWTAAKLMSFGKLALQATITESLKGGKQVYAVVTGKSKGQAPSDLLDGAKARNSALVEEMQARLEKLQEDLNDIQMQPQNSTATNRTNEQGHLKQFPDEPLKSSPQATDRRKIFIRSRL